MASSRQKTGTRSLAFDRSAIAIAVVVLSSCASNIGLPPPRSLVNSQGVRLQPDRDRMAAIDRWVQEHSANIEADPSFLIRGTLSAEDVFLWDAIRIHGDTADVSFRGSASDARLPYQLYAHFYLMKDMGRLDEFLPEGIGLEGFEFERVVLKQVSDAWLYGRAVFDLTPYALLDELMYATEHGWLDAYVLTARAEDFPEERRRWLDENPGRTEEYRAWFQSTFQREPPGLR